MIRRSKKISKRSIKNAVIFGYLYRTAYEDQIRKHGKIVSHYKIADYFPAFELVASWIASNMAWDIVKASIKITIRNAKEGTFKEELVRLLDDAEFAAFYMCIREFTKLDDSTINPIVANAIGFEQTIDNLTDKTHKKLNKKQKKKSRKDKRGRAI